MARNLENNNESDGAGALSLIALVGLTLLSFPIIQLECESHLVNERSVFQKYEDMTASEKSLEDAARKRFSSAYNVDKAGAMNRFSLLYNIQVKK